MLREYAPDEAEAERLLAPYRGINSRITTGCSTRDGIVAMLQFAADGHPGGRHEQGGMAGASRWSMSASPISSRARRLRHCVNHKPHPEPVEQALALLDVSATNAIFVGDSPPMWSRTSRAGVYSRRDVGRLRA